MALERLTFLEGRWPISSTEVIEAADLLRRSISARNYAAAIVASVELSRVAQTVTGGTRTPGVDSDRPTAVAMAAFAGLDRDPLFNLGSAKAWDEIVDAVFWWWLGVGWRWPIEPVVVGLIGAPLGWSAFVEERDHPGRHPRLRSVPSPFKTDLWALATRAPWPDDWGSAGELHALSADARLTVAASRATTKPAVVERRMLSFTLKWSEQRLNAALAELEHAGLASSPAPLRDLAGDLSGADLRALAVRQGLKQSGTKRELAERLIRDGDPDVVVRRVNESGWYAPISVGADLPMIGVPEAVGKLWAGAVASYTPATYPYATDVTDLAAAFSTPGIPADRRREWL